MPWQFTQDQYSRFMYEGFFGDLKYLRDKIQISPPPELGDSNIISLTPISGGFVLECPSIQYSSTILISSTVKKITISEIQTELERIAFNVLVNQTPTVMKCTYK